MIMTPYDSNFRRRKPKVGRGVKMPRNLEERYGRTLRAAVDAVFVQRVRELVEQYEAGRSITDVQQFADAMQIEAAQQLQEIANRAVPDWFSAVDAYAAGKFTNSLRDALGIDATSILEQSVYDTIRNETITANVGLIRDLSGETYQMVKQAILADYQGLGFPGDAKSLAGRIQDIIGGTKYRASVIARDQTAKLNSDMVEARQEDAGIAEYEWRNAGDQRVVGNPAGLYPKVTEKQKQYHGNHWEREGKIYPVGFVHPDGKIGHAIMCRCVGLSIIVPRNLRTQPTGTRTFVDMAVA